LFRIYWVKGYAFDTFCWSRLLIVVMPNFDELLLKTSRTFGLTIPYLPEPFRREITLSYLLFRIADTLEDGELWSPELRAVALAGMEEWLQNPESEIPTNLWSESPPTDHSAYAELLQQTPAVVEQIRLLDPVVSQIIVEHSLRSLRGMKSYLDQNYNDTRTLRTWESLQEYCYFVAGIVGELLTEIFIYRLKPLSPDADNLRQLATAFGEGLQLVNILKDSFTDANEGRNYLPTNLDRQIVSTQARADLLQATRYAEILAVLPSPIGVQAFVTIPIELAIATLDRLEISGAGSKLTRAEVSEIVQRVETKLQIDPTQSPLRVSLYSSS